MDERRVRGRRGVHAHAALELLELAEQKHLLDRVGEEGERGLLTLSVVDGRLALDGVIVEDERPQGFKAPERPPIGFALASAGGSSSGSAALH